MVTNRFTVALAGWAFCALAAARCVAVEPAGVDQQVRQFDQTIAPLLAGRCLECHNASDKKGDLDLTSLSTAQTGGDSGPAIVAGKPLESYLWQRIAADEMPPKKPLDAVEKDLLKNWIAAGAVWGTSPIDRLRFTTTARAGYDWWSLEPVKTPPLPAVRFKSWPRGPIDRFVLARLEAAGLAPSPEADRRTRSCGGSCLI